MTHAGMVWLLLLLLAGCEGGLEWNWPMLNFFASVLLVLGVGCGLVRGWNYMRRAERRDERR
jgi:hypothetical protein